jgi:hypothetical protein
MSATGGASTTTRKTTSRRKVVGGNGNNNNGNGHDMDAIRLRLFEPKREKKDYELDVFIIGQVASYEDYLTETFEQKPASNKVVEMLLEESLKSNSAFQLWLKDKLNRAATNNNGNGNGSEDDEALLENLTPNSEKNKTAGSQQ